MKLFLAETEDLSVECSIPYEHFKVLVEAYRRGYIMEAVLPIEYRGTIRKIALSAVNTPATLAFIYNSADNSDRRQLENLGTRIEKTKKELITLAEKSKGSVCELGGGK
jgi:hypothetical protein